MMSRMPWWYLAMMRENRKQKGEMKASVDGWHTHREEKPRFSISIARQSLYSGGHACEYIP